MATTTVLTCSKLLLLQNIVRRGLPTGGTVTSRVCFLYGGTKTRLIADLLVGTPPQNVSVIFDTGSFTLEFTSGYSLCCFTNRPHANSPQAPSAPVPAPTSPSSTLTRAPPTSVATKYRRSALKLASVWTLCNTPGNMSCGFGQATIQSLSEALARRTLSCTPSSTKLAPSTLIPKAAFKVRCRSHSAQ